MGLSIAKNAAVTYDQRAVQSKESHFLQRKKIKLPSIFLIRSTKVLQSLIYGIQDLRHSKILCAQVPFLSPFFPYLI